MKIEAEDLRCARRMRVPKIPRPIDAVVHVMGWRDAGVHVSLTDDERDRLKQQVRRLRKLDAGAMTKTRTDLTPRLKKKVLDNG